MLDAAKKRDGNRDDAMQDSYCKALIFVPREGVATEWTWFAASRIKSQCPSASVDFVGLDAQAVGVISISPNSKSTEAGDLVLRRY